MSVFRGIVTEFPGIIVDHFTPSNCQRGQTFFLSHCHRDHMTGLDSSDLIFALASKETRLYCSEVTKGLLSYDTNFAKLVPYLKSLPVEEQVTLKLASVQDEKALNLIVTLLPAGHCPGSVMFLFQSNSCTVLYTGDFRLSLSEVKRLTHLHSSDTGVPLSLTNLYLDTTFCHKQAENIISREETRELIIEEVEKWLSEQPRNAVYVDCPSFGYEHILLSLSKRFSSKIHIAPWRMRSYSVLPEVQQCLTLDGEKARIHACGFKKNFKSFGLPCGCGKDAKGNPANVLRIKPSTQWFVTSPGRLKQPLKYIKGRNMFRVLHSMHASYNEIRDIVSYLSPSSIVPCVIPYSIGDTSIVDLHDRIRKLLPIKTGDTTTLPTIYNNSINEQLDEGEELTVHRRDPGCREDGEEEREWEESDYETDDEYYNSEDCDKNRSHDQSCDRSFDMTLPALHSNIAEDCESEGGQPLIDLSFSEGSMETKQGNSHNPSGALSGSHVSRLVEEGTSGNHETLPQEGPPKPKRRKTDPVKNDLLPRNERGASIESTSSSVCLIGVECSSTCIIDLTRGSSSEKDFDSVIITGTSKPVCEASLNEDSTSSISAPLLPTRCHQGSTPIGVVSIGSTPPPFSPHSPSSPSFLPPTPGREKVESAISRRTLGFM